MKTIYQLSSDEFDLYIKSLRGHNKKAAIAQFKFESNAVSKGYKFPDSYSYIKSKVKVDLICENGHLNSVTPDSFNGKNSNCKQCIGNCRESKKEKFYEEIKKSGYKLGDNFDFNYLHDVIDIECNNGHRYSTTPKSIINGARCRICLGLCSEKSKAQFHKLLSETGYKMSCEYEYKNAKSIVELTCPAGHVYHVSTGEFASGTRCSACQGASKKYAKIKFNEELEKCGYSIVSGSEYISSKEKIKVICNNGHHIDITPNSFMSGVRCSKCSNNCQIKAKDKFESLVNEMGFSIADGYEYEKAHKKIKLICPVGHEWLVTPTTFKKGNGCAECCDKGFKKSLPGVVYVLRSICGSAMKVGISNVFEKRLKELKLSVDFDFIVIEKLEFDIGQDAFDLESKAHKMGEVLGIMQNSGHVSREWMKFDQSIIDWLISEHREITSQK